MKHDRFNFNRRQSFGNIPQYGLIKGTIAPGFVDYGAVLSKNMDISSLIADRKLKESEYAENIENSPSDIDVAKIPDAYEPILTDYLTGLKMNYSEGAKLLRDNKVGSEAYKRGQELMRNATSEIANLDKEFTALQAASLEDIKNIQQDMYSDGNNESNQINTGSMLLKGQWSPDKMYFQNGKIFLRGGGDDGEDIAFSDLRLRFLKDGKSMQSLTGIYNTLVDAAGKSGREFNSAIDAARVNDVLTAANSQGIRSLAYDYNFPIFEETQNEDGTTTTTETKVNYAKSDRARKIADEQFNGNMDWIRDINNSELLRGELLSYFNDTFKTAITSEVNAYNARQKKIQDDRIAEILARKNNNNNNSGLSKYTQETIDGVNSIINNPVETLKAEGLNVDNIDNDFDAKSYEEKYFTKLALNVAGANKDTNVLNFSDARRQFLKNSIAIEGAVNKIKEDGKRDQEAEPLLEFMAKIMDGSYNKNLGGGKNYFIDGNPSYMPQEFFTEVKRDEDGIAYRQLTQQAQDLLTEIGYISSDYTEQVDVGTKRYKNFQAFIDDVKNMTFNRFVPGTGNLGPAKMFVFRTGKDGVDLRGLQGSILTEQGRNTLFNSIISSGLYTAAELRASGGNYSGSLTNYNYTGSN